MPLTVDTFPHKHLRIAHLILSCTELYDSFPSCVQLPIYSKPQLSQHSACWGRSHPKKPVPPFLHQKMAITRLHYGYSRVGRGLFFLILYYSLTAEYW